MEQKSSKTEMSRLRCKVGGELNLSPAGKGPKCQKKPNKKNQEEPDVTEKPGLLQGRS
jgi:hypothetical protein